MTRLALFDLDHTLLPIDSDHEWGRFLVKVGAVDGAHYAAENERFYAQYKAGILDIHAFLRFALKPLADHTRQELDAWHREFMQTIILPHIKPAAIDLVKKHQDAQDVCCIVTATNSFVTRPIAQAFGINHLVATEPEVSGNGDTVRFTGAVAGLPNFKEGKVTRVEQWLKELGLTWSNLEDSCFYSDSINDLPLLEKVNRAYPTNPDDRLLATAQERNWPVLRLFS
jgi:HAD superfamily hydrolase (TIGR01490 family)